MLWKAASFLGLPTFQFWLLAVCKNGGGRGRSGLFYHVNDVSVYLGGQGDEEGCLIKRACFVYVLFVLNQEWYIFCLQTFKTPALGKETTRKGLNIVLSIGTPPPPPSVYLGRHWRHSCKKMDQAFPSFYYVYCKQSKTGRWEGLGTRLVVMTECLSLVAMVFYFIGVRSTVWECAAGRSSC